MGDAQTFGLILLVVGLAGTAAVLSNRLSAAVRVPAPALFLVGAAVAADLVPSLGTLSIQTVERIVTVALAAILLDGGMHIGRRRFASVAGPVVWLGRAGTLLEGESGANDPVGIALMAALLTAGGSGAGAFGQGALVFGLQMAVGAAVGLAGGAVLLA